MWQPKDFVKGFVVIEWMHYLDLLRRAPAVGATAGREQRVVRVVLVDMLLCATTPDAQLTAL